MCGTHLHHESPVGLRLLRAACGYPDLHFHLLLRAMATPALTEGSQEGIVLLREKPCRTVQA